jgi:hypothetical protein
MNKVFIAAIMMAGSTAHAQPVAFLGLKGVNPDIVIQLPTPMAIPSPLEATVDAAIKSAIDYAVQVNDKELETALVKFNAIAPFQAKYEFVYNTKGYHLRDYGAPAKGFCDWVCRQITKLVCKTVCDPECHEDCADVIVDSCKYVCS